MTQRHRRLTSNLGPSTVELDHYFRIPPRRHHFAFMFTHSLILGNSILHVFSMQSEIRLVRSELHQQDSNKHAKILQIHGTVKGHNR